MITIWKFEIEITDEQFITIPEKYKFLCVQMQAGIPCIWAAVDSSAPKLQARIIVHGTGHPCDDIADLQYIGTIQEAGGMLVFHVFGETHNGMPRISET